MTGAQTVLLKYFGDERYSRDEIIAHDLQNKMNAIPCKSLLENLAKISSFDVIGVDEGHFFSDIIEFSESLANQNKIVIISALDADFRREPF